MKNRIPLLISTLVLTSAVALAQDRNFDRTLSVAATPSVNVSTGAGSIHIHPGSDNQVHIVGHIHGNHGWMSGSSNNVQARIQQIADHPPIVQTGNEITIGERHANDLYRNLSIDYDITLPRTSSIVASSGSGDVEIQDAGASLKADSGSGTIRARGIHGAANLQTGSGDIELIQVASGDVHAQTGSGSLRLTVVSSALRAGTGSGDIEVNGAPTSDWRLETGSGNIHLNVGSGSKFSVNASTGSGSIRIEQPFTMQGELNRNHINASVNGGGSANVKANTGSGDIQIR